MRAFMSFEWLKLRKRRLPRVILLLLVALTALAFWGQGTSGRDRVDLLLPRGWLAALIYCSFFATFFWPVLGATWAGNEYGWGTVRAVLTRRPGRRQQVLAGLAVLLLGVAAGIVVVLVTGTVGGIVVAALTGNDAWTAGVWSGDFLQVLAKGAGTSWLIASF